VVQNEFAKPLKRGLISLNQYCRWTAIFRLYDAQVELDRLGFHTQILAKN
jgi:hypothetical protein